MSKRISNPAPPVKKKPPYPGLHSTSAKLTKCQIQGIRLLADLFVLDDLTKEVMSKILKPEQLEQFKLHMKTNCPELTEAGEELKRQIIDARRVWKEQLEKDNWL